MSRKNIFAFAQFCRMASSCARYEYYYTCLWQQNEESLTQCAIGDECDKSRVSGRLLVNYQVFSRLFLLCKNFVIEILINVA